MSSSSSDDTTTATSSTSNPAAFRSFWNAPTAQINTNPADEYQGIPRTNTNPRVTEATPLLSTTVSDDNHASKRQRYTICCLMLLLLLIMAAVWFWFHHSAAVVPGLIIRSNETDIATVCNPFSYIPKPHIDLISGHGIVATIRYLQDPNEQSLAHTTTDYQHGNILNQTFFLSSFNVPTRSFTNQFQDQQQHLLPSQFFAMTAYTRLGLTQEDHVGDYQLALLSDDGSTLTIVDHPSYVLIDNDGVHTTQLTTAKRNLTFHHQDQKYDIIVNWFQGPPSHIALMLLWRPSTGNLAEPNDGISGNDEWFNWRSTSTSTSTPTSIPTSRYMELLQHGWRVIPAENFWLPEQFPQKPILEAKLAKGEDPCQ